MIDTKELRKLVHRHAQAAISIPIKPAMLSELLDRLETAESEALEEARLNGMGSEREAALMAKLEAAEKETASWKGLAKQFGNEADALRLLVVMRFDHDHPPQFAQGYCTHELTEPVTAEHCRLFVAEITRLRAKIKQMERQEPVAYMPLATKAALEAGDTGVIWNCRDRGAADEPLYALPGAQTQGEWK